MTSVSLGASYLETRLKVLELLRREHAYSDVVREAQEVVELALKGVLRVLGVEPPKIHDVGPLILEYRDRLPGAVQPDADRIAEASRWLRKEREFSFYGEVDLIPTEEYGVEEAERALADARFVVGRARVVFASVRGDDEASRRCRPQDCSDEKEDAADRRAK
ncbi:MAG: HEPN domain-containing protein [Spirochaetaceae bacterium]|nr:HEPN domain-containing protein [Spirochaetaceae bacterium]